MNKKLLSLVALSILAVSTLGVFSAARVFAGGADSSPTGCPGGPAGPPSPGTICPDNSVPLPDNSLPIGCPGSGLQGPVPQNYVVVCPERPGRTACAFYASTGQCNAGANNIVDLSGDPDALKIQVYAQRGINLLTALAGLAIIVAVIIGGIQYSASGGNPQASGAAKKRIGNAVLALLALVFLYTFLQWIVPGGIFAN